MSFFDRWVAGETLQLNENTRAELPGRFLQLSDGITHYDEQGPTHGEAIVHIHGFSVPHFIWDPTIKALAKAGLRVIRYDLYGRGYSDRPQIAYDRGLFRRQLKELIDELKISGEINLLALSMGAVVAADFAAHFPEKIARLSLIAPAAFDISPPLVFRALLIPGLGEMLLGALGRLGSRDILQAMLTDFYQPSQAALDAFIPPYLAQMQYQGFKRALLSSIRNGMLAEDLELYKRLARQAFPIQLIWGEHDQTVPFRHNQLFRELLPRTQFHSIKEAGHIPHFEKAEEVNPILVEFFQS